MGTKRIRVGLIGCGGNMRGGQIHAPQVGIGRAA